MNRKIHGYLMNKETGGLIGVNLFGLFVTDLYQKQKSVDEIVRIYENRFFSRASSEETKRIITEFIDSIRRKGLTRKNLRVIKKNGEFHLLTVQLDLSWDCNLTCRHCYLGDTKLIDKLLTKKEWQSVIDQASAMDVPKITFLGGEPLLSPYFFDLAHYAHTLNFKMYTTTNGVLVTPEIAVHFVKSGFNEIDVSIDGAIQESHEFLRGKDTFNQTLKGIENLVSAGLIVKSATVLYKKNFNEVIDLLKLGQKLGIRQMYFNLLLPGGNGKQLWQDYKLTFEEWLNVIESICDWNKRGKRPKAFAENRFNFNQLFSKGTQIDSGTCEYAGCKAGKRELLITPDGFAVACPLLSTERQFHKMNIRQYPLEDIWQKEEWIVRLRQVNETTIRGKCRGCQNVMICKSGCHILVMFECGNIREPDPRCPY